MSRINRILIAFDKIASDGMNTSSTKSPSTPSVPKVVTPKTSNATSVNNTLSKARHNADLQPLDGDNEVKYPAKDPSYNTAKLGLSRTTRMSRLKDNRILNMPIHQYKVNANVGSMRI